MNTHTHTQWDDMTMFFFSILNFQVFIKEGMVSACNHYDLMSLRLCVYFGKSIEPSSAIEYFDIT